MFVRYRRSHLHSTPSLLSLASSVDSSIKEETLSTPTSLADCDDQLETYQILLQGKTKEKSNFIEQLKALRSEKEPLLKVKSTIQEDIIAANILINSKSEEVTRLKPKLRHHSEKQIHDNIERLEFQLRNNNYKPREEQKILDEIGMLKRSFKTLREFDLKQRENMKYRSERSRLIDQRNEVFSQVQAIILQEEEFKREINEFRHIISSTMKTIEHLKTVRPELEKACMEDQKQKKEVQHKRQKEKTRERKEQYMLRQQERERRWKEYEESREPYEKEKDLCKMVLAYFQSALPNVTSKADSKEESKVDSVVPSVVPSSVPATSNSSQGSFYSKPKDDRSWQRPRGKKNKAKAKREMKAVKVRNLSHPPDVLANLATLSVSIPRTTDDIPPAISAVEAKLQQFNALGKEERKSSVVEGTGEVLPEPEESPPSSNLKVKNETPTATNEVKQEVQPPLLNPSNKDTSSSSLTTDSPATSLNTDKLTAFNPNTDFRYSSHNNKGTAFTPDSNSPRSFFSNPVPIAACNEGNKKKEGPCLAPTYASVAAASRIAV